MVGMPGAGRYAPSPSGDLHYGNLRTALLAWLWARSTGRDFRMRVDDIDTQRSSAISAERQLADLAALGIDWDGDVLYQHDRFDAYANALRHLEQRGLVYECYCSRREIQEASRAPHAVPGSYPGTCRLLDDATRITPGISGPTVSPLALDEWVAVRAMVPRKDANWIMDQLAALGAQAILASEIRIARI